MQARLVTVLQQHNVGMERSNIATGIPSRCTRHGHWRAADLFARVEGIEVAHGMNFGDEMIDARATSGRTNHSCTVLAKLVWLTSALLLQLACSSERSTGPSIPSGDPAAFRWSLPDGFPQPLVPADNPMSDAKVELGRRLFYDTRLSGNNQFSCSSCHRQSNAFADARNRPFGSTGEAHPRNSMSLPNVAYHVVLGWANPQTRRL